jgi:Uma2 family endonuclease
MATAAVEKRTYTAEELYELCQAGGRYELVKGELREMPPAGEEHGFQGAPLVLFFGHYAHTNRLGRVALAETGFLLARDPDTVRAPDMAFIRQERLPEQFSRRWSEIVPNLVAEVVSPNDAWVEVAEKVAEWLAAGVRLVWVVNPRAKTVTVYRSLQEIRILTEADTLDGEEVAPGFSLPVAQIFA